MPWDVILSLPFFRRCSKNLRVPGQRLEDFLPDFKYEQPDSRWMTASNMPKRSKKGLSRHLICKVGRCVARISLFYLTYQIHSCVCVCVCVCVMHHASYHLSLICVCVGLLLCKRQEKTLASHVQTRATLGSMCFLLKSAEIHVARHSGEEKTVAANLPLESTKR